MDSIAGISKGLADMFQLDHNILLSLLLKIKRAESVAAFRPSEQHNCYTQERFFAEAHKGLGMVIIPMSIMHIIIPKRVTIMLVRLLSVTGVPVPFSMGIA